MTVQEAYVIASRVCVDYYLRPADAVIIDLARVLGPEVVCAIAGEQQQAAIDHDERWHNLTASLAARHAEKPQEPHL